MQIEVTSELTPDQKERWGAFLKVAQSAHPEQDPRFAVIHQAEGREVVFALGSDNGALKAVAMFVLTAHPFLPGYFSDAMAFSGPVCDNRQDLLAFLSGLKHTGIFRKIGRLRITPYWLTEEGRALGPVLQSLGWRVFEAEPLRYTGMISLEPSETGIYESFSKGARIEFRKAQRQALDVEFVTHSTQSDEILKLLNRHRGERNMGEVARAGFVASFDAVFKHADLAAFVVVRHERRIVAGMAAYCGRACAHPAYYFTDPEELRKLQNLRIAPFIWHRIAVWAKANGCTQLDVEGFKASSGPDDKLYLVHKYKADLGAVETVRVAGHQLVLNTFVHVTGNARELARRAVWAIKAARRRWAGAAP